MANTSTTTTITDDTQSSTVPPANPALGDIVHDSAVVSEAAGFTLTGTVTFSFYNDGSCTNLASTSSPLALGVDSPSQGPLAAGSYGFEASYSGDPNHNPSTSNCESFTVAQSGTTTSTEVKDSKGAVPQNGDPLGTQVHDTATVGTQAGSFVISGTATYHFYSSSDCSGSSTDEVVTLNNGAIPDSSTSSSLGAGSYSYLASYSGDGNYKASDSSCEPFTINKASPTVTTNVLNKADSDITNTAVDLGTTVHDTSTLSGAVSGFPITGSITYHFYATGDCSDPSADEGPLGLGTDSTTQTPGAGSYSYSATYSGNSNYNSETSACEPFTISQAKTSTSTTITDETQSEIVPPASPNLGDTVHDSADVTGAVNGFSLSDSATVTYSFYSDKVCSNLVGSTESVSVGSDSSAHGPLAAGDYSFKASYSGNSNYKASDSDCEPFTVSQAPTSTSTVVFDETLNANVPQGGATLGDTVHDTSAVTGTVASFTIEGTVTYSYFTNDGCTGTATTTKQVTMSGGSVPNSESKGPLEAGQYSFSASYGGDNNYLSSDSKCESFTVNQAPTTTSTTLDGATLNGKVDLGSMVGDSASVLGTPEPFTITGSATFNFLRTANVLAQQVTARR